MEYVWIILIQNLIINIIKYISIIIKNKLKGITMLDWIISPINNSNNKCGITKYLSSNNEKDK